MKIKEICDNIRELFENVEPSAQEKRGDSSFLIHKLPNAMVEEGVSVKGLEYIFETFKKVVFSQGKNKQVAQEYLLNLITELPFMFWGKDDLDPKKARSNNTPEGQVAECLINFAQEVYAWQILKDAYSGKRRAYILELLNALSYHFEVPEFMQLCRQSLSNKGEEEFLATIDCMTSYFRRRDELPNEEMMAIIDQRIKKTKSRSEVVTGLNFYVELDIIDEFEALGRLDNWKDRNKE